MKLSFQKRKLHLKETFSIAYGNYDTRDTLIVTLSHHQSHGYGECVGINYYNIDLNAFERDLKRLREKIEKLPIIHPTDFFTSLLTWEIHPFLMSALDCAYWDLYGKLENKSFLELNNLSLNSEVESSYTISIGPIKEQIEKMENSNWSQFKVKCKGLNKEHFHILSQFSRPISLDSNASFTAEDCIWIQENKEAQHFKYLEQPLPIGEYNVLKNSSFANWMADEDVQDISYLSKLLPHYQSVNVKLMKCGGLTPALSLIQKAKFLGYKVMLGCMTESSVGISAACALAPLLDFADLDGANLISNDFAKGSYVENGKIIISDQPGLGISMQ